MTHHQVPERSRGETLDETIDRVAAGLTMVSADPALAGRIAEQLHEEAPFPWPRLVMASAAVAMLVFAVVLLNNPREEAPSPDMARTITPPASPEPIASRAAAPRDSEPLMTAKAVSRSARARKPAQPAVEPLPEWRQLEALASPAPLALDGLSPNTLAIEPVSLAPLDLADLAVGELDERDDPKE